MVIKLRYYENFQFTSRVNVKSLVLLCVQFPWIFPLLLFFKLFVLTSSVSGALYVSIHALKIMLLPVSVRIPELPYNLLFTEALTI